MADINPGEVKDAKYLWHFFVCKMGKNPLILINHFLKCMRQKLQLFTMPSVNLVNINNYLYLYKIESLNLVIVCVADANAKHDISYTTGFSMFRR